ncbi:MAG: hypothetical protein ACRDYB_09275 [Acidimicrobiales bacterium]
MIITTDHHPFDTSDDDGYYQQRVIITLDVPGGPGIDTTAAAALLDVLHHFQQEAIQAHWIALEISGPTTTP